MLKIFQTVGIPSSGKSTWAIQEIQKDPENFTRINNDLIRLMYNNGNWSSGYEKFVSETRNWMIKEAIRRDKHIIIDNLNIDKKHWQVVCDLARASNKDVMVIEKLFYIDLEEAIARDAKREGKAKVGEEIIKFWWKKSGGKQLQFYKVKTETFTKNNNQENVLMVQDETKPKAIICDLDGSIAEISHRSPYDASQCLADKPVSHVIEMVKMFHQQGYKIIFCSGREDKFRDLTKQWLDTYVGVEYQLFMRPSGNFSKDAFIKENIFNEHIKDKYYVRAVIDDRLQVCQLWHRLSLPLFRVGNPDACF